MKKLLSRLKGAPHTARNTQVSPLVEMSTLYPPDTDKVEGTCPHCRNYMWANKGGSGFCDQCGKTVKQQDMITSTLGEAETCNYDEEGFEPVEKDNLPKKTGGELGEDPPVSPTGREGEDEKKKGPLGISEGTREEIIQALSRDFELEDEGGPWLIFRSKKSLVGVKAMLKRGTNALNRERVDYRSIEWDSEYNGGRLTVELPESFEIQERDLGAYDPGIHAFGPDQYLISMRTGLSIDSPRLYWDDSKWVSDRKDARVYASKKRGTDGARAFMAAKKAAKAMKVSDSLIQQVRESSGFVKPKDFDAGQDVDQESLKRLPEFLLSEWVEQIDEAKGGAASLVKKLAKDTGKTWEQVKGTLPASGPERLAILRQFQNVYDLLAALGKNLGESVAEAKARGEADRLVAKEKGHVDVLKATQGMSKQERKAYFTALQGMSEGVSDQDVEAALVEYEITGPGARFAGIRKMGAGKMGKARQEALAASLTDPEIVVLILKRSLKRPAWQAELDRYRIAMTPEGLAKVEKSLLQKGIFKKAGKNTSITDDGDQIATIISGTTYGTHFIQKFSGLIIESSEDDVEMPELTEEMLEEARVLDERTLEVEYLGMVKEPSGKMGVAITINGQEYHYTPTAQNAPAAVARSQDTGVEQLAKKFKKVLALSPGRALAWLRKNAVAYAGTKDNPLGDANRGHLLPDPGKKLKKSKEY